MTTKLSLDTTRQDVIDTSNKVNKKLLKSSTNLPNQTRAMEVSLRSSKIQQQILY